MHRVHSPLASIAPRPRQGRPTNPAPRAHRVLSPACRARAPAPCATACCAPVPPACRSPACHAPLLRACPASACRASPASLSACATLPPTRPASPNAYAPLPPVRPACACLRAQRRVATQLPALRHRQPYLLPQYSKLDCDTTLPPAALPATIQCSVLQYTAPGCHPSLLQYTTHVAIHFPAQL